MKPLDKPLWSPSTDQINDSELSAYLRYLDELGLPFPDYHALYAWSIINTEQFWSTFWDFSKLIGDKGETVLVNSDDIEKAVWFPDARLNYAENLLQQSSDEIAIYFKSEDKVSSRLSYAALKQQVTQVAGWLREQGVVKGDVVAAYMANMPETIVAMLATTSIGAIWTSTSPDFGAQSVIERFGQTKPKVLFTQDGYFYNGKQIDIREKTKQIKTAIDSLQAVVSIDFLGLDTDATDINWRAILSHQTGSELLFEPCGFNDPLFILYSSGTTGVPKCITHKVGGTLLQHKKEHQLHTDIKPGDTLFYFTTCGWMMWNWLASALASKATIALYDGSPFYPDRNVLWDYVDEVNITHFGTSAKYIDALKKRDATINQTHQLERLRVILSTGSVLAPESFDFVYENIKQEVCLSSISGGTDIVSCFVLGCPILPVVRGQSQCRGLGMAVEVFDDNANALIDKKGELVCTKTFPAQPAFFWGDETGEKYHNAYFAEFPNVWHHGDYIKITEHGGICLYGRSDATLNPGGVRIGTAEIYRYVEQLDEVNESIVIGQDWRSDVRVILFVVLRQDAVLNDELVKKIKLMIRTHCTPRHVPAKIISVKDIPRTKSGKLVELAVREIVHGRPVKNMHALANPEALRYFENLDQLSILSS